MRKHRRFGVTASLSREAVLPMGGFFMKRQKGQSVIEFALVFPLWIMAIWLLSIFGFLFLDYLTLSNVARSSAREAVLLGTDNYETIRDSYVLTDKEAASVGSDTGDNSPSADGVAADAKNADGFKRKSVKLLSNIYIWQGNSSDFEIKSANGMVTVTITPRLNNTFLGFNMANLMGALPQSYKIEYSMYDESSASS